MLNVNTARFKSNDRVMIKSAKGERTMTNNGQSILLKYPLELVGEIATIVEAYVMHNSPDIRANQDVHGFEWIEYAVRLDDHSLVSFRFHELCRI